MKVHTIHESLINGQRQQINEYGLYDFWTDYKQYLFNLYMDLKPQYEYFTDAVQSYHRITNR